MLARTASQDPAEQRGRQIMNAGLAALARARDVEDADGVPVEPPGNAPRGVRVERIDHEHGPPDGLGDRSRERGPAGQTAASVIAVDGDDERGVRVTNVEPGPLGGIRRLRLVQRLLVIDPSRFAPSPARAPATARDPQLQGDVQRRLVDAGLATGNDALRHRQGAWGVRATWGRTGKKTLRGSTAGR